MLLHQVKNVLSEKCSPEFEFRASEYVIEQLMNNQVHITMVPNSFKLRSGFTGIRGSSKPTLGPSGSWGSIIKSFNVPMYDGKQTLDYVNAFCNVFKLLSI